MKGNSKKGAASMLPLLLFSIVIVNKKFMQCTSVLLLPMRMSLDRPFCSESYAFLIKRKSKQDVFIKRHVCSFKVDNRVDEKYVSLQHKNVFIVQIFENYSK